MTVEIVRQTQSVRFKRRRGTDTVSSYTLTARDGSSTTRWRIAFWAPDPVNPEVQRRRFKRGFVSLDEAEQALEEVRVQIRRDDYQPPSKDMLNAYAATYFETIRVKASTLAGYKKHYRVHVEPSALGRMKLASITKTELNRFYRRLEADGRKDAGHAGEGLSPATVRHIHTLLSQILSAAVEDGLLRLNPAKKAKPPTKLEASAPEMQTWSAEEAKAFLAWSKERADYLWLAWYVLLSTGLRRGELLAMRWRDIDFDNGVLHVARSLSYVKEAGVPASMSFTKPKSGHGRPVDLDDDVVAALRGAREAIARVMPEWAQADALVFRNRYGRPHNPVQFSRQWRERVAQAQGDLPDLPTIHLHELRHTHATLLLRRGIHPKIVSERLGHADVNITLNTYTHVVPTLQRSAATAIRDILGL